MNFMKYLMIGLSLLPAQLAFGETAAQYLKPGTFKVEFFQFASSSQDTDKVVKKIQAAAQKDPAWFQSHVRKAKPGQPLPYDPKLGVTEAEYQAFIKSAQAGSALRLQKTADGSLKVTAGKDGGLDIEATSPTQAWEAAINANNQLSVKGISKLSNVGSPFDNPKSPMGHLKGLSWSIEEMKNADIAAITGTVAKLTLGRVVGSAECFMNVDVKVVEKAQMQRQEQFTVKYPCP